MKDIKFVDGLRAFKPHVNAPDFVKAALEINIEELISWLKSQQGEKVRLDLKESKSGTYYCAVNTFTPKNQGEKPVGNNGPAPSRDFDNPPADDFDDDVPF
tara:strand:+ start:37 stop:339 length:303 start_codon:yes stop_codon:yes gene_type:complete